MVCQDATQLNVRFLIHAFEIVQVSTQVHWAFAIFFICVIPMVINGSYEGV
jgi:hypothetical protein